MSADGLRTPVLLDDDGDRVALVTGAAGAIGRSIVASLVKRGWAVLATDLETSPTFGEDAARVRYVRADVCDPDAMAAAAQEARDLGTLRACIANAGIVTENFVPFLDAPVDVWEPTLRVNVLGTLNTFQAAARVIGEAGGGRMAATASVAGVRAEADIVAYSASKAGVISIVRSLALDLGPKRISVNGVAPGPVRSDAQDDVIESRGRNPAFAGEYERFREANRPFGRLADTDEVAEVFAWLLSDAAGYITGQVITIDGGGVLT
jgi:NAD(P)-dependent dehydrogenase (short-subunit alcohol dehydrogenase family)